MIPLIIIPLWDPTLAAREIERCATLGAKSDRRRASFLPPSGCRRSSDPGRDWDPVFAAAQETGMPISIQVGSSSTLPETPDAMRLASSRACSSAGWRPPPASTGCSAKPWLAIPDCASPSPRAALGGSMTLAQMARQLHHNRYMDDFEIKGSLIEGGLAVTRRDKPIPQWPHGEQDPWDVFRQRFAAASSVRPMPARRPSMPRVRRLSGRGRTSRIRTRRSRTPCLTATICSTGWRSRISGGCDRRMPDRLVRP